MGTRNRLGTQDGGKQQRIIVILYLIHIGHINKSLLQPAQSIPDPLTTGEIQSVAYI